MVNRGNFNNTNECLALGWKRADCLAISFVFVFAFMIYIGTINHSWVLDDANIFYLNEYVTSGFSGWGDILRHHSQEGAGFYPETFQYRPVSQMLFATEWQMVPNSTTFYHLMNILWYALSASLLYVLLRVLFRNCNLFFSLIIALIFVANPMHTEVVANIKSRDELCCFAFIIISMIFALKYVESGRWYYLPSLLCAYLLAIFSKESAITALVLIPLVVYFFSDCKSFKKYFSIFAVIAIVAVFYLVARHFVLSAYPPSKVTLIQNYLADQPFDIRLGSAMWLLLKYLVLAFVPYRQVCDYSFSYLPYVSLQNWRFVLSFVIYVALFVYAMWKIRKKDILSFCILFWIVSMSIYANIVYLIGASFADRFLFMPILATSIAFVEILFRLWKVKGCATSPMALKVVSIVVVLLFSFVTIVRAADWKDSYTLFSTDAEKVKNDARIYFYLGDVLREKAIISRDSATFVNNMKSAIDSYSESLLICNEYPDCYANLGFCYLQLGVRLQNMEYLKKAAQSLDSSLRLNIGAAALYNRAEVAYYMGDFTKAVDCYLSALESGNHRMQSAYLNIANSYFQLQKYDQAVEYYQKAIDYNPNNLTPYQMEINIFSAEERWIYVLSVAEREIQNFPNIDDGYFFAGVAYCQLNKYSEAEKYFNETLRVNPDNYNAYFNLAYIYDRIGDSEKSALMTQKGNMLKTKFER